jgi:hypothetical protein
MGRGAGSCAGGFGLGSGWSGGAAKPRASPAGVSGARGRRRAISAKPPRTDRAGLECRGKSEAGGGGQSVDQTGSAGPASGANSRSLT